MARPNLLSDRPRSSDSEVTPATPIGPASAGPASAGPADLAQWLTRDLRPKGAASSEVSAARGSELPPSQRPSQPQTVVITESQEPPVAGWLLDGVKPRGSVPPEALGATLLASRWESVVPPKSALPLRDVMLPRDALVPAEVVVGADAVVPAAGLVPASDGLAPPDSLVPLAVTEAPPALALRDPQLDAEDLAVLPSRRGKKRDWRKLVVLAALLSVAGAVLWVTSGARVEQIAGAAAAAAPAMMVAPLPPPPPSEVEVAPPAEPELSPPLVPAGTRAAADAEPELDLDQEPGRRGRRAGDAVARFADLPSPTLSRLAREEQQRARKSAASIRAAKKPAAEP